MSPRHRIVFLESRSVRAQVRRPSFAHEWVEYTSTSADQVIERLRGATIAITNKAPIDAGVLEAQDSLQLVAVSATGVNNVDVEACHARNIAVCNVRGYAGHAVPEHALALMLALRRNLFAHRTDVQDGAWQRAPGFCLLDRPMQDLAGATLGIIGYGSIGRGTACLGEAFGMNVLIAERRGAEQVRADRVGFDTVIERADVLSIHCPLSPLTRDLIGAAELARMKPGAILINTARGGIINETALADALTARQIAGAAVDVLSQEPPRDGNPLLDLNLPNLIVTPHVAWASEQAMQALADQLIDNIEAFDRGSPRNLL